MGLRAGLRGLPVEVRGLRDSPFPALHLAQTAPASRLARIGHRPGLAGLPLRLGSRATRNLTPLLKEAVRRILTRRPDKQRNRRLHAPLPLHVGELYQRQLPGSRTESTRDLQLAARLLRLVRQEERLRIGQPQPSVLPIGRDGTLERRKLLGSLVAELCEMALENVLHSLR